MLFSDNLPYKVGTRNTPALRCYFLVNPAKSYTFGTTYKYADADAQRQWNNFTVSSSSNTVNAGKYLVITTTTPKFKNLGRLYSYSATGRQDYTPILADVKYLMECWGARGGYGYGDISTGSEGVYSVGAGTGGYTSGIIKLSATDLSSYPVFYLYVGQAGPNAYKKTQVAGGWNGGGKGGHDNADNEADGGGGGATDIRLTSASNTKTTWYDFTSLKSRIMVAGAGGGSGYAYGDNQIAYGGRGGNTTGGKAFVLDNSVRYETSGTAASQTSGYKIGQGADGKIAPFTNACTGGGGGGYWGGNTSSNTAIFHGRIECGGHGGSSYISGYSGCVAVLSGTSDSNVAFRSETNAVTKATHISGLAFTDGSMSDGDSIMPNPAAASGTITGNSNNGYARITIKPYD